MRVRLCVCVCACASVRVHLYLCVRACVCASARACVRAWCLCASMFVHACSVRVRACVRVWLSCASIRVHGCMHTRVCACMRHPHWSLQLTLTPPSINLCGQESIWTHRGFVRASGYACTHTWAQRVPYPRALQRARAHEACTPELRTCCPGQRPRGEPPPCCSAQAVPAAHRAATRNHAVPSSPEAR